MEVHPSHGFADGDPVRVVHPPRPGFPALVTETIRPDTVFVPYHWPVPAAANALTIDALDPRSKIPEYKVCAGRMERGTASTRCPSRPTAPGQRAYEPETRSPAATRCRPRCRRDGGRRRDEGG